MRLELDAARASARVSRALAAVTALLGSIALLGWALGEPQMTSFWMEGVSMKANTALALLLCGAATCLHSAGPRLHRAGSLLFAAVFALGLAQLIQDVARVDLGIDQALFREVESPVQTHRPGRMSSITALGLVLIGVAAHLSASQRRWAVLLGQWLLVAVLLISVHVLFGYAYGVRGIFMIPRSTAVSMHTALAFSVQVMALFYLRPGRGVGAVLIDPRPSGLLVRRMFPFLLIAPLILGWAASVGSRAGYLSDTILLTIISTGQTALVLAVLAWTAAAMRSGERALLAATDQIAGSERVFRASFENAFVGMAHLSGSLKWLRVNECLAGILEYEPAELARLRLEALVDGEDLPEFRRELELIRAGEKEAWTFRQSWFTRSGEERFLDVHVSTIEDDRGRFQHFMLVLRDMTKFRRDEEDLRVRTRSLDDAGNGVVIADARMPDFPIVYVNETFERLTGYSSEEVLGTNCRFLNRGVRDQPGLEVLREALRTGGTCTVVLENRRKDGEPFWIELTLSPVYDGEDRITHFIGIQNDITERNRLARERERLLEEARTARDRAEEATRARDVLLAVVSHELRSPLNSIRLWSTLIHSGNVDDGDLVLRAVGHIESSVDLQSRLIDDLLDASRISSGRLELEREELDLGALVGSVVEEQRPQALTRRIELELDRPGAALLVDGDWQRLRQTFRNLLDNALKFTSEGGHVRVRLAARGEEVEVAVRDDGCGLSPDQLSRLFDQFWQAEGRSNRSYSGLGLGLNIVRHLVERHDGSVTAESEGLGRGATFRVRLPLRRLAGPDPGRVARRPEARGGPAFPEGLRLLVVDDEATTAEALALALRLNGFQVATAFDVESARASIARERPQVLISDLMMPGTTGFELVLGLREEEEREGLAPIKAIAISGRGSPSDRRKVLRSGFDAFMPKPIRVQPLVEWIEGVAAAGPSRAARRVLVLGEHEGVLEFLAGEGHALHRVDDVEQALELGGSWRPHVVLVDLDLPGEPLEALAELRLDRASLLIVGWTRREELVPDDDQLDFLLRDPVPLAQVARVLRFASSA